MIENLVKSAAKKQNLLLIGLHFWIQATTVNLCSLTC